MKKTNNKGFSLVELIVVIAIMAVLIGVLAPTFTKYVEQSRRSTDIQNAEQLKAGYLADIADGTIVTAVTGQVVAAGNLPTSVSAVPTVVGNAVAAASRNFSVTYDPVAGTCEVSIGSHVVTTAAGATSYKAAANA